MKNAGPKVVAPKNLPARFPLISTIAVGLLLDRLNAPGWLWGAVYAIFVCLWIGTLVQFWRQRETDIFEEANCTRCKQPFERSLKGWLQPHPPDCVDQLRRRREFEVNQ